MRCNIESRIKEHATSVPRVFDRNTESEDNPYTTPSKLSTYDAVFLEFVIFQRGMRQEAKTRNARRQPAKIKEKKTKKKQNEEPLKRH